jgi:iron(III) transport system ATP-binding protein
VIQQIGSPRDIYARPCNAFVSTFIGHSNLFFGTIRKQGGVPSVVFEGGYHVEMPNLVDTVTEGQRVVVSVRPEEFSLNQEGMDCEIISRTFLGKYTNYFLRFGEGMVLEDQPSIEYSQDLGHVDRIFAVGEKIRLRPNPNKINVFTQDMEQSLIKDVKRYDE